MKRLLFAAIFATIPTLAAAQSSHTSTGHNHNTMDPSAVDQEMATGMARVLSQNFTLFLSLSDFAISRFKKLSAGHIKNEH